MTDCTSWDVIAQKPPLGLRPEYVYKLERIDEITAAMNRYILAKKDIPYYWVEEYLSIFDSVNVISLKQ